MKNRRIIISLICIVVIIIVVLISILLNQNSNKKISDNYILRLSGGSGEITFHTYVYRNEENNDMKYKYILATATTVSWGSPQWTTKIDKEGFSNSIEDIIEIAEEHGCGYALYNGELITSFDKLIEEFSD